MSRSHGVELRGLTAAPRSDAVVSRFGRMFRSLPAAVYGKSPEESRRALQALSETMVSKEFALKDAEQAANPGQDIRRDVPICESEPEDENPTIASGYTYLGQFIDHDITLDTSSSLESQNDPDAIEDFRTPRFDLDSVYGRGPDDQPYLYDKAMFGLLQVGEDKRAPGSPVIRPDHIRGPQEVALIGDPRNDENLIVQQIHTLFVRFHNAVLKSGTNPAIDAKTRFQQAQRLTRWHYQWIVLHEFLKRIVGEETWSRVLNPNGTPNLQFYQIKDAGYSYMPVEFSVAAYRFGHSMVRPSYSLNNIVIGGQGGAESNRFHRIPVFTADRAPLANLNGFRPLPGAWGIDWSFFFENLPTPPAATVNAPCAQLAAPVLPQPSYRIDSHLVDPLGALQDIMPPGVPFNSLALRNLLRSFALGLPSGQDVAMQLGQAPINDAILWSGDDRQAVLKAFPAFAGNAPLWFYVLREAEEVRKKGVADAVGGHHLGPVGGTIVAEVLVGLAVHDAHSYLSQAPRWQPTLGQSPGRFTMADLVTFTDANA